LSRGKDFLPGLGLLGYPIDSTDPKL